MSRAPLPTSDPVAPCDGCHYVARCASTRETCSAFRSYVAGNPRWHRLARVPELDEHLADALVGEAALALDE